MNTATGAPGAEPLGLLDSLLEAVWLVDAESFTITAANHAASTLLGRRPGQIVGQPAGAFTPAPEDSCYWDEARKGLPAVLQSRTRVVHADGHTVAVERRIAATTDASGRAVYLVACTDRSAQQDTEDEMERVVAELRATLDSTADGLLVCDLDGAIRAFNRRFADLWHLPKELLLRRDDAAVHARLAVGVLDADQYATRLAEIAADPLIEGRDTLVLKTGQVVERSCVPQWSRGRAIGRVFAFRDITEQVTAQADLRLAAKVFESSLDAILIAGPDHRILAANPGCQRITRSAPAELVGRPAQALFQDPHEERLFAHIQTQWAASGYWEGEVWHRRLDGTACAVQLTWVVLRDTRGAITQSVAFFRDLTAQRADRQRIEELAFRDVLTGLPNRALLAKRVDAAMQAAHEGSTPFAILFIDLDRFKTINDSLGHQFGDRVLVQVAERINRCLRQVDTLCRLGGDEFVLYLHGVEAAGAEMVARRVLDDLAQPLLLDGMRFSIHCSIGVALYPHDGATLDELLKHADTAMFQVKERGRGHFHFYRPQMHTDVLARMKLEHAMRHALTAGEFVLHYQPQIDIGSGALVGAEALLRWHSAEMGTVSPGQFIPLAEETGDIVAIGAWVLLEAVREAAGWQAAGRAVPVSVNVSALQFRQADFADHVAAAIALHGLRPELLELELTESILVQDAAEALERLHALAALGVRLSIDDFGTGYSSLGYLKRFPIHKLKIDQSFIRGLPDDESDQAIVSAIISVGRALGLTVIAEGVEQAAQRDLLGTLGCEQYQGFLCAPGLPAAEFTAVARELSAPRQAADKPFHSM